MSETTARRTRFAAEIERRMAADERYSRELADSLGPQPAPTGAPCLPYGGSWQRRKGAA